MLLARQAASSARGPSPRPQPRDKPSSRPRTRSEVLLSDRCLPRSHRSPSSRNYGSTTSARNASNGSPPAAGRSPPGPRARQRRRAQPRAPTAPPATTRPPSRWCPRSRACARRARGGGEAAVDVAPPARAPSPPARAGGARRYGLLRPTRSTGGLRLYSLEDLERVRLMRRHIDGGLAAAEAAGLVWRTPVSEGTSETAVVSAPRRSRSLRLRSTPLTSPRPRR